MLKILLHSPRFRRFSSDRWKRRDIIWIMKWRLIVGKQAKARQLDSASNQRPYYWCYDNFIRFQIRVRKCDPTAHNWVVVHIFGFVRSLSVCGRSAESLDEYVLCLRVESHLFKEDKHFRPIDAKLYYIFEYFILKCNQKILFSVTFHIYSDYSSANYRNLL